MVKDRNYARAGTAHGCTRCVDFITDPRRLVEQFMRHLALALKSIFVLGFVFPPRPPTLVLFAYHVKTHRERRNSLCATLRCRCWKSISLLWHTPNVKVGGCGGNASSNIPTSSNASAKWRINCSTNRSPTVSPLQLKTWSSFLFRLICNSPS